MIVHSFGLHEVGGVSFLLQANGAANLISPALGNPFTLKLPVRGIKCPHHIELDHASDLQPTWLQDPLVQALLPLPAPAGGQIKILLDPHDRYAQIIQGLTKLVSPTELPIQPVWWNTAFTGRRRYMATNIGPIIWTSVEISHVNSVVEHCDMTRTFSRTTLIVARHELPIYRGVEKIQTGLTRLPDGDFEAIGGGALRRWMQDDHQDIREPAQALLE